MCQLILLYLQALGAHKKLIRQHLVEQRAELLANIIAQRARREHIPALENADLKERAAIVILGQQSRFVFACYKPK